MIEDLSSVEFPDFLRSTLNALSAHIAILDESGVIITVNDAWGRFARDNDARLPRDGIGSNYLEICDSAKGDWSEDGPLVARKIRQMMAGDLEEFIWEYPCHSPSQRRWFVLRATRFLTGNQVRVVVAHENITERKLAEEELRASEEKLNLVMESIEDVFWMTTPGIREIAYVSPSYEKIWGRTRDSLYESPKSFLESILPEDLEGLLRVIEEHKDQPWTCDYRIIRPDGTIRWIQDRCYPISDETGTVCLRAGVSSDITNRKKAEEQLQEAYREMDQRVHERTAELQTANERLRREIAGHKETERALRASEERYRAIFANAPVGIDVADPDGRLTSVNGSLCEMLGYTEEELLGRSFRDITFPQDLEPWNKNFEALVQRRIPAYDLTKRYLRKDGEVITVRILTAPLLEQDSNDASVICVIEDITERERVGKALKESQRKLRERDELFQAFMDYSPVVAFVKDEVGRYVYINKPWEKAFGRESSEVLGKTMQEVWPLESALLLRETDEVVLASNKPLEYVRFLTDPTGKDIHLWVYKFPISDSDGNRLLGGLALDITKQKNDEKALRESEEKYRLLVETMNDGVGIADAQGTVTYGNKRFEEMLGYSRDEIIGRNVRELVDASWQFEFNEQFCERKKGSPGIYETVLVPRDGSSIPVIVSSTPLVDERGTFSGALAVFTDISELKETQEKLLASLKEKEVLLQEIHHRVKNNLQLVLSLLRMQARKFEEPKIVEVLSDTENRVFSIALVHEKLYESPNLSTIRIGHYFKALTNHVVLAYHGAHPLVGARVQADDVTFSIDTAVPLGMIVTELVSNVLRHAFPKEDGSELCVTLHSLNDEWYELCVADNGIGIRKTEDLGANKSMGLGLVRTFTEQLDGTLQIESDAGTRVLITFRDIKRGRPKLH